MSKTNKDYDKTIDRVDNMIRENNKKYLDQKSQEEYEKALQQFQKQKQREMARQYAQQIKEGNKKAIQKKQRELSINKGKNRLRNKSSVKQEYFEKEPEKPEPKQRQRMSEKEVKKVQKAVEVRAERHMQEMELQRINKKLEEERRKTKLFELTETCQKLLSKSHKRIPPASTQIPIERRVLLEKFSKKAEEEVEELDNIISGLIEKSKTGNGNRGNDKENGSGEMNGGNRRSEEGSHNNKRERLNEKLNGLREEKRRGEYRENREVDIFSEEFEMDFMKQIIKGAAGNWQQNQQGEDTFNTYRQGEYRQRQYDSYSYGRYSKESPQDLLFTKPASELFSMDYIPIN